MIPYSAHERFLALPPGARFRPVPRAGHVSPYERPEVVNPLVIEFLEEPAETPLRGEE